MVVNREQELVARAAKTILRDDLVRWEGLESAANGASQKATLMFIVATILLVAGGLVSIKGGTAAAKVFGGVLAIAGAGVGMTGLLGRNRAVTTLDEFKPSREILSVRVGRITIASRQEPSGNYLIDRSRLLPISSIPLPSGKMVESLATSMKAYDEAMTRMPPILGNDRFEGIELEQESTQRLYCEEADVNSTLQLLVGALGQLEVETIDVRLLGLDRGYLVRLRDIQAEQQGVWVGAPAITSGAAVNLDEEVKKIARLEGAFGTASSVNSPSTQIRGMLDEFAARAEQDAAKLDESRRYSLAEVADALPRELRHIATIANYHCYCPTCNGDFIAKLVAREWEDDGRDDFPHPDRATIMNPVPGSDVWECPVCANRTPVPFRLPRLLDELIYPVMDRLLQENRVERIKLYGEAEERKRTVLAEVQRELRDSVDKADRDGREIKGRIRDIITHVASAHETMKLLMTESAAFEALAESRLQQIGTDMEGIVDRIHSNQQQLTAEFNSSIEKIAADSRAKYDHLAVVAHSEWDTRMSIQERFAQTHEREAKSMEKLHRTWGKESKARTTYWKKAKSRL